MFTPIGAYDPSPLALLSVGRKVPTSHRGVASLVGACGRSVGALGLMCLQGLHPNDVIGVVGAPYVSGVDHVPDEHDGGG